jgi:hypothetical protein
MGASLGFSGRPNTLASLHASQAPSAPRRLFEQVLEIVLTALKDVDESSASAPTDGKGRARPVHAASVYEANMKVCAPAVA